MRDAHASWRSYQYQLKEDYTLAISTTTRPYVDTYNSYEKQHDAFVHHAQNSILGFKTQIKGLEGQIEEAEKQKQLQQELLVQQQQQQAEAEQLKRDEWDSDRGHQGDADYESGSGRDRPRSSRWDAAGDPTIPGAIPPSGPPGVWKDGPDAYRSSGFQDEAPHGFAPHRALPDLSRFVVLTNLKDLLARELFEPVI